MINLNEYYDGKIKVGAAYYPEVWKNDKVIDDDIAKMKALGINCVRMGEFAWANIEKEEGKYDISFFKNVIDRLYKANIMVIFCTPSATPPKWLTDKYHETLKIQDNGIRKQFGGRVHACKSNPKYREKVAQVVEYIAKELSNHPGIIGWQIDNEMYYYDGCYCDSCKNYFIKFLENKYGTIENLNNQWGNERWSLMYKDFNDIIPPRRDTWNHPTLQIEWIRFHSFINAEFIHKQSEIIKKYSSLPVSTDMMPLLEQNIYEMNSKLDLVQFNHYEPSNYLEHASFWFDYIRPIKDKPFWITETQVTSYGGSHPEGGYRPENSCYVNTWLPIAKGAELNLYWHWREHYSGQEIFHGAVLSSCGRYCYNASEIKHLTDDFKKCERKLFENKISSKIALQFSTTSWLTFNQGLKLADFNYEQTVFNNFHKHLRHYNIDVIDTYNDVDKYDVIISPYVVCIDENGFKEKIVNFVNNGGTWIVGPCSDILNHNIGKYTNAPFGFLEDFAGIYLEKEVPFQNDVVKAKWDNGEELGSSIIYGGFKPTSSKSLATYTEGLTKGLSAITVRKIGKGKIFALGTQISGNDLLKLIELKPILEASNNIELIERGNLIIAIELDNKEGNIVLDGNYVDLLSGKTFSGTTKVKPFTVLCLEKQ